ncbi:helix-turn-helix transcriptional regulator [Pedobacter sp. UBA4863]|uniref:helix-turn-helix domain-containing protein n=1 Tax=Pedobacter sp. UBA4863 TaxID=1947060 RepID=UPI0025CCB047|nr:helix-turn-helix transcriptional regulator [Pedobacter sp. UBA4863]
MNIAFQEEKIHEGKNLKRIREIIGLKQEALGAKCPANYSQQRISEFENQWSIDEPTLQELAKALGVNIEFIRSFNEEKAIYNIQNNSNTYNGHAKDHSHSQHYQPNINYQENKQIADLLEKLIEDDKTKSQAILDLTKIISDLAEEVRKLRK